MAREFIVPGEIISGSGALDMAEGALKLLGKKALIVTDKVMIDLGNCAKVEKALTNQGIEYSIYSDICGEPTDTMIEKGLQIYKDANCDFLVALCHCVEAYTSRKAQTLSDTFAVSAVKRIFKYLPVAYKDGKNEEARVQMSVAALEAGIAFNNASVTIIHGMSRPIGALFHVAHGLSNAMLLKECLTFALPGAYDRFGALGRDIGVADATDSDQEAAEKFLKAVESLVNELDTPTLEQFGINKEEFFNVIDKMAHDAMDSGSPQNTMRDVTEEEVKEIYRKLW